jgi:hypothetical protein
MTRRRFSVLALSLPLALVAAGCQKAPEEIVADSGKKKDYKEYRPHRMPWEGGGGGGGNEYFGPSGSSGGGHNPKPHPNH